MVSRKKKSNREVVLNVLGRAYPEYLWGFAISILGEVYEGKDIGIGSLYVELHKLFGEGLVERKQLTLEEMLGSIDSLKLMGRIKEGDIYTPIGPRVGYRITQEGKRVRVDYYSPQLNAESGGVLIPVPA